MNNLKEQLTGTLGLFGYLLFVLIACTYSCLPCYTIAGHFTDSELICFFAVIVFYFLSNLFVFSMGVAQIILWFAGLYFAYIDYKTWYFIIYLIFFIIAIGSFFKQLNK